MTSFMAKLNWYRRRLQMMSVPEVLFRTGRMLKTWQERWMSVPPVPPPQPRPVAVYRFPDARHLDRTAYERRAQEVLEGRMSVFALTDCQIGQPPQWNRDPLTGTMAPLVFGKHLDYRDERLVGNIKYLWEINRHLQLVWLAQAYYLTGDQRYGEAVVTQLEAWFEQCPYPLGVNWCSALELGIRLINWSLAWQMLGGIDGPLLGAPERQAFTARWLEAIFRHQDFIAGYFSRFSSANNHLIGEASGLFVAASLWPFWPQSRRWRDKAQAILEAQILEQNFADGVNKEQAVAYQQFVLDFAVIADIVGENAGVSFSQAYRDRLVGMLEFVAALMDAGGHLPRFGDDDDGFVVRLDASPGFCPFCSLLTTAAVRYRRRDLLLPACFRRTRTDEKTLWLLGDAAAAAQENQEAVPEPVRRAFPEGGYYILGSQFGTPREVKAVVDCGPLGFRSIAAHGHADALSMVLSLGGRPVLIDPGTYAYHTQPKWRNYFRGTSAHNTIRIDGVDQSVIGGNFMWLYHARSRCEHWYSDEQEDCFIGSHEGYTRLTDAVVHRRRVHYDKATRTFRVEDELVCESRHSIEQFWHFSETCEVILDGCRARVTQGDQTLELILDGRFTVQQYCGDEVLPLGWVSWQFDKKVPCCTLYAKTVIEKSRQFLTRLVCP